jgi:hypothetical protein
MSPVFAVQSGLTIGAIPSPRTAGAWGVNRRGVIAHVGLPQDANCSTKRNLQCWTAVNLPVRSFDPAGQRTRKVHHACGIQAKENGKCNQ